jgi:SNF2 family DNA or RNA helicase
MTLYRPHKYQDRTTGFVVEHKRSGVLNRPGLGKTVSVLTAFHELRERFDAWRALVVAPLSVCHLVWPAEIKKWDHLKHLRVRILHGPDKLEHLRAKADVYVVNPAGLKWLAKQHWDIPDFAIVDEMTAFKHHTTVRAKQLAKIFGDGAVDRRVGMTGTPAPNGLEDLFGEALMLDDGVTLGDTLNREKWAADTAPDSEKCFYQRFWFAPHPNGRGYSDWGPTTRSEELIYKALEPLMIRLDGGKEMQLPKVVYSDLKVELPEEALKLDRELRAELILQLQTGVVTAFNAGALISKRRQLAAGAIYVTPDGKFVAAKEDGGADGLLPWEAIHDAKLEKLGDLWEESGRRQLLVTYVYKHSRVRIQKYFKQRFKLDVPFIGGGIKPSVLVDLAAKWNAGELAVLLGHPQSMGHGLNLQESAADQLVWYDPTYDLELYEQVRARLDRMGQTSSTVFVYHILANRSIDATIEMARNYKADVQDRLLAALLEDL